MVLSTSPNLLTRYSDGGALLTDTAELRSQATFRDVFAVKEFRALWLAYLQSIAGDQLARVALTVLVFQRTRSPWWTALTYAMTYLPWILGGLFLAGLADRFPRKRVMVACDWIRCLLVVGMAIPWAPLQMMVGLAFVVTLLNAPFNASRSAITADILPTHVYPLGIAVITTTLQVGTVAGFGFGGIAVAAIGVRPSLLCDAGTFGVSALVLLTGLQSRPAPAHTAGDPSGFVRARHGLAFVFSRRRLRMLMMLGWLMAFYTVPEALAVPYTAQLKGGVIAAGLIFASGPFGNAIGSVLFGRLVTPERRQRWMFPLAVASCAALVVCAAHPDLGVSLGIFALSGAFAAYQLTANAEFVSAVPDRHRGQAFGIAGTGLQVGQGLAYVAAGAIANTVGPAPVIALVGITGAVAAAYLMVSWSRNVTDTPTVP